MQIFCQNIHYLCQSERNIEEILGIHVVPSQAGGDNLFRPGRRGRAGHPADGRGKVAVLPAPGHDAGGPGHRRVSAYIPDKGPGTESPRPRHQGPCRPLRHDPQGDRHHPRQCRLRRLQVPLPLPRAPAHRDFPEEGAEDAGEFPGGRRGTLHLPVGLRLPAGLPPDSRYPGTAARGAGNRPDSHCHSVSREGHRGETAFSQGQYHLLRLRAPQPLIYSKEDRR